MGFKMSSLFSQTFPDEKDQVVEKKEQATRKVPSVRKMNVPRDMKSCAFSDEEEDEDDVISEDEKSLMETVVLSTEAERTKTRYVEKMEMLLNLGKMFTALNYSKNEEEEWITRRKVLTMDYKRKHRSAVSSRKKLKVQ